MNHASLFSGIGGFDLAAEWMGWENVFNCEWEEFPRQVLKHHFPNAIQYGDIKELDATTHLGRVDILTGGFPCQPYSLAGKRMGKEDERHLWPEMCRVIREVQPRWVVGENVRGLIGWNGGMVFDEVQADLEAEGYEVTSYVLPACAVGAPHRRDRVWFVAYAHDKGGSDGPREVQGKDGEVRQRDDRAEPCHASGRNASDTNSGILEGSEKVGRYGLNVEREGIPGNASDTKVPRGEGQRFKGPGQVQSDGRGGKNMETTWEKFPTVPPVCGGDDGLPKELDGLTFPKWRRESIKAYGNAIVPQVALQIFKAIKAYEDGT